MDAGLSLVSGSTVGKRAFATNSGVPLGAVIDFKSPGGCRLPQLSRQPLRCRACAAYLNPYCKVTNVQSNGFACDDTVP